MDIQKVEAHFGGATKLAHALGLKSHASVWLWRRDGIPHVRQCQIEVLTEGLFKAERKAVENATPETAA